jgi:hypothetical protein
MNAMNPIGTYLAARPGLTRLLLLGIAVLLAACKGSGGGTGY